MYRGNNSSRIIPIILVLVVIALAIAAIVSIGRALLGGGDAPTDQVQTNNGQQALLNTSATHSVRMTVRGPIVANEEFHTYRITVAPNARNQTAYTGYLDQVTNTENLGNNTKAYEEFVYALDRANLMKGTQLEGAKDDTRGVCATGYVYEFDVLRAQSVVKHLWTSTCDGSKGSLDASLPQVRSLFMNQIPGSDRAVRSINFRF